jgi:ADP-ribose pyrophosphatase YjhB (NUDIX family)
MPTLGVLAVIMENGRILLTQRDDFAVWCLPGGALEDGESLEEAAAREVSEETGLQVRLTRLVGVYSQPQWHRGGHHFALFAGQPVGGALRLQAGETIDVGFFELGALPEPLVWWHRQPIADALAGAVGVARVIHGDWPLDRRLTRDQLYALRDQSGLSRQQFYLRHWERLQSGEDRS